MKKNLFVLFSCIIITSCQNKSVPAKVDTTLKVGNGSGGCSFLEEPVYIINKDYVIYQDCYTHKIINADVATFGIKEFGREGFAFDKNGIFVKGDFLKIDTTGFTLLGKNKKNDLWWKTKTKVFKNVTEIKADTFPRNRGKRSKIVLNPDDANKIKIDYNFYKQNGHIYFNDKRTGLDAETFKNIDKSHRYYKDKNAVYYFSNRKEGIQELNDLDLNSVKAFNGFLTDKNYLYCENVKIIKSKEVELLAIFPGYRKGCGFDQRPGSDFYLFSNIEGFWLVKISDTLSKRFLGKTFNRSWDPAFDVVDLHKKYKNFRINEPQKPVEVVVKRDENEIYNPAAVDELPKYPGGIEKLYILLDKNFIKPKSENKDDFIGQAVFAHFVIEKDGSISDIKILRDFGYGSGKELERVLKLSSKWKPATIEGKPVRCLYNLPYHMRVD